MFIGIYGCQGCLWVSMGVYGVSGVCVYRWLWVFRCLWVSMGVRAFSSKKRLTMPSD